jgi:signal transduction histidine kinase
MNASERRIADMHSVLNILNVLLGELSFIEPEQPGLVELSEKLDKELNDIARTIKEGGDLPALMQRIRQSESEVMSYVQSTYEDEGVSTGRTDIRESIDNLKSVYSILNTRLSELEMRMEDPDIWIQIEPDVFRQQLEDVFIAIAKNSKGGYGVQFNLAQVGHGDYYFDLKFDVQPTGGPFWMPLRLVDVLRDLCANARKYTSPGGKIALAVYQDESTLNAVIEDSGCGIPGDELEKVTEFGYRASNVRQRPTLGGGFGLTKAAWLVTNWGGRLNIKSEVDQGTIIKLSIPNAHRPENSVTWEI